MQRPKQEIHRREHIINPEFSSKIPAKKTNLRKKILAGQQSAQHGRRPNRQILAKETEIPCFTEEQVRSSAIYKLLEEQMRLMANRQQIELNKLKDIKQERQKQYANLQKEQYQTKVQIWQLKNQVLDLKQSINEEKQETLRLMSELGIEEGETEGLIYPQN